MREVDSIGGIQRKEIEEVDLSCILRYVSSAELERYENEQFRVEAEAEAVALRADAEELARRRLKKNARVPGAGRGSWMVSRPDLETEAPTRQPGRPRGSRGKGRGRGRGRGRGSMVVSSRSRNADMQEGLVHAESEALHHEEEGIKTIIRETNAEKNEEAHARAQTSPSLMRSAFVANSALKGSPVQRRLSASFTLRGEPEAPEIDDDSDFGLDGYDAGSTSSAALQLRLEDDIRGRAIQESKQQLMDIDEGEHCSKRRRTESAASSGWMPTAPTVSIPEDAFRQTPLFQDRSSVLDSDSHTADEAIPPDAFHQTSLFVDRSSLPESDSDSADGSIPAQPPSVPHHIPQHRLHNGADAEDTIRVSSQADRSAHHQQHQRSHQHEDEESVEEYAVESIIEHFCKGGKKYYLVKWEGYDDKHDWLPEEDLEGAADLVAKYNEQISRSKGKEMR
jgi:hypothetical protein